MDTLDRRDGGQGKLLSGHQQILNMTRISVSILGALGRMGSMIKSGLGDWSSKDEANGGSCVLSLLQGDRGQGSSSDITYLLQLGKSLQSLTWGCCINRSAPAAREGWGSGMGRETGP